MSGFENSLKTSKTLLKTKTNEYLSNKQNLDALRSIIDSFKDSLHKQQPVTPYLLSIETIFTDVLKSGDMIIDVVPLKIQESSPQLSFKQWLSERYAEAFDLVVECFVSDKNSEHQALVTSMKLLAIEGSHSQSFPILQLNKIISKLLLSDKLMKNLIVRLSEYTAYEDFRYYTWKLIMKNLMPTNKNDLNTIFIQNYLELLNVLIVAPTQAAVSEEEDDKKYFCKSIKLEATALRKNVNKVWNFIVQWPHTEFTQRQLLVLLLEKIIVHLEKPTMLTDYLMDTLDIGGPISLLALQGIFILIHKYNMSYPNIYEKLYMMFEPEIFHMKFKPRLFYLADIFLTSTYLPETLVAAFMKRLARLALIAPPQDIIIILYFIGNLIVRHPGLKRLIYNHSMGGQEVTNDPFVMDEADPNKSRALESSLWEIQLLRNHMLPNVSQAAKHIITQPIKNEWDLGNYLELKENDIFDQEISMRTREYALTFMRPLEPKAHQHTSSAMSRYWKF